MDLGSSYIHDALQGRCSGIGVQDARIPRICGDEHMLVEAAKRRWIATTPLVAQVSDLFATTSLVAQVSFAATSLVPQVLVHFATTSLFAQVSVHLVHSGVSILSAMVTFRMSRDLQ